MSTMGAQSVYSKLNWHYSDPLEKKHRLYFSQKKSNIYKQHIVVKEEKGMLL